MYIIEKRLSLDIHLIKGVLSRPENHITWERVKSFEPSYMFINNKDKRKLKEEFLPKDAIRLPLHEFVSYKGNDFVVTEQLDTTSGDPIIYNWTTHYVFKRDIPNIHGEIITITEKDSGIFSWLDALHANLPIDAAGKIKTGSAWYKYKKQMIDHRAFKFGAYAIGADLLAGCDEVTEMLDVNNIIYDINDDEVTILTDEKTSV